MEKVAECPICLEAIRFPHNFGSCGHGACALCVARIADARESVTCPICRKESMRSRVTPIRLLGWEAMPSDKEREAIESLSAQKNTPTAQNDARGPPPARRATLDEIISPRHFHETILL